MRLVISALALALCACSREPSFDERYSQSENAIEERARNLGQQLNESDATSASEAGSDIQTE